MALRWVVALGASSLAGCTADIGKELPTNEKVPLAEQVPDLPVEERTERLGAAITTLAGADIADEAEFVAALEAEGIAVESLEMTYGVLELEYLAEAPRSEGVLREIGSIAGAYAALIDTGHDATTLEMTIVDRSSSTYGVAEATTKDAKRYNAGDLSGKEYGELVAGSIGSKRHPPDVTSASNA